MITTNNKISYYGFNFNRKSTQKKNLNDDLNLDFCNGFGFLLLLTIVIDLSLFYYKIIKPYFIKWIKTAEGEKIIDEIKNGKIIQIYKKIMSKWWSSIAISATVFLCIFVFLLVDTASDRRRLISFFGLIVLIICGFLCSNNPARIRYSGTLSPHKLRLFLRDAKGLNFS